MFFNVLSVHFLCIPNFFFLLWWINKWAWKGCPKNARKFEQGGLKQLATVREGGGWLVCTSERKKLRAKILRANNIYHNRHAVESVLRVAFEHRQSNSNNNNHVAHTVSQLWKFNIKQKNICASAGVWISVGSLLPKCSKWNGSAKEEFCFLSLYNIRHRCVQHFLNFFRRLLFFFCRFVIIPIMYLRGVCIMYAFWMCFISVFWSLAFKRVTYLRCVM